MIIIGITGTYCAGKGEISEYLETKGFIHLSVSGLIKEIGEELQKQGLINNRGGQIDLGNFIREKFGASFLIDELIKRADGKDCVIESIRTENEVKTLLAKENSYLISVDADPEIRYNRSLERKSEKDGGSFKEFIRHEKIEMHSDNPDKQNLSKCMEMADFKLTNNDKLEIELYPQIEYALSTIKNGKCRK